MRILITNDDGIHSPGLAALATAASIFGEVRVVAPDVEHSSTGHAITASRPLRYRRAAVPTGFESYRVDGTPADCVALGAHHWGGVDVVLSGINLGPNLGHGTWHSGTLAAAKQAQLLGIPGIALSTPADEDPDFPALEPHVQEVLRLLLSQHQLPLVNVNLPRHPRGIRFTRQEVGRYDGHVVPAEDPAGRAVFWFTVRTLQDSAPGTDRWAMENGFTSVTPLRLDLTDHEALERLRETAEAPPEVPTEPPAATVS